MTIGELVAFNAYLVMLAWPMIAFGWVTNLLQRGMASWKRMLEVLDAVPAVSDAAVSAAAPRHPEAIRGEIEFREPDVRLTAARRCCTTSRPRIPAGTTTAIVGATGSGKTTLLQPARAAARPAAGHGVRGRHRRAPPAAGGAARRDRVRAAGAVPVQRDASPRTSRSASRRAAGRGPRPRGSGGGVAPARQGRGRLSERLRHARRRARHHAVGRTEAAHGASRARWSSIRASSSSTTRCRRWTPTPRKRSSGGCAR